MSAVGSMNQQLAQNTKYLELMKQGTEAVNKCLSASGKYGIQCASAAMNKYIRKIPFISDVVYPWKNFDWDYEAVVAKGYNPKDKGASGAGNLRAIIGDIEAILHIISGFLVDANPNSSASAGDPNAAQNDLVKCIQNNINSSCGMLNKIKEEARDQKPPYPDPFFQSQQLNGEGSSSYFVQVGICPTKIKDEKTCKAKGYTWTPNPLYAATPSWLNAYTPPGMCTKKKYAFMDNRPGLKIGGISEFKGLIPSLANDVLDLSPDKIMATAMGVNVPGFNSQHCEEGFQGSDQSVVSPKNNLCSNALIALVVVLLLMCGLTILNR